MFADTYMAEIAALPNEEQVIGIFMNLSALGIEQPLSSNILEFFKALPACAKQQGITFSTPTEICMKLKSVDSLYVPDTLSWMDEERDVSTWLGNPMQREAFNKLYSIADRVRIANDPRINQGLGLSAGKVTTSALCRPSLHVLVWTVVSMTVHLMLH